MMTVMSCALAAQSIPAFADASSAQKEQVERAHKMVSEMVKTDDGCRAMCEAMISNRKSKKMMCEMLAKDSEAVKMIKGK